MKEEPKKEEEPKERSARLDNELRIAMKKETSKGGYIPYGGLRYAPWECFKPYKSKGGF